MSELVLKSEKREKSSKGQLGEIRRNGRVPATCYSISEQISVSVALNEFEKVFQQSGEHILIDLDIAKDKKRKVLVKGYQISPVKKEIIHVDFFEVSKDREVRAKVPIKLKGLSAGVKRGGVLEHKLQKLTIRALPDAIPAEYVVDVTAMEVGDSVYAENMEIAKNVKMITKPRQAIVTVSASRTTKMEEQQAKKETS
ncbi:MAG: 50S ribosomal protein L25 [Spirochaetota bacterium]|nr:50S ribosomal protein L25 [Spirochaetota bacterium]